MRVLVACEFSGTVRDAFAARGHDAWSCDLLETEAPGNHIVGDARAMLGDGWDLLIAHPPCTDLAVSGARWWNEKREKALAIGAPDPQTEALDLFRAFLFAPIPRVAVENPVGAASRVRVPDQIIQPWQFGHGETKATCLWLRGLPLLMQTCVVPGRKAKIHTMAPGPNRWRERSRTYQGIADAMAAQWNSADRWRAPQLSMFAGGGL